MNAHMTAKFIELHTPVDCPLMVNIAHISEIYPNGTGTTIVVKGQYHGVEESYEQIKNALSSYLDTAVIEVK